MQPTVVIADSFECGLYDSVLIYCHCCITITMTLKLYPMPFIRWNSITKSLFNFIYSLHPAILLFFLSFNVFGRAHNRSSKIIVCCRVLTCDSGPELESAYFCRLQLRLPLQTKRSTPTYSKFGLDSNSAALLLWHADGAHQIRLAIKLWG